LENITASNNKLIVRFINSLSQSGILEILELRFKLQKNHISKLQKKAKLHTCALEHTFVQKPTKSKKHTQNSKKSKKNIFFLNQFQL